MQLLPTQLEANCIQTSKNAEEADSFQDFSASTSMNQSDLPHIRKATELIDSTRFQQRLTKKNQNMKLQRDHSRTGWL